MGAGCKILFLVGGAEIEMSASGRDINNLLEIWDLDEVDLTYRTPIHLNSSHSSVNCRPLQREYQSGVKYCGSCHALNDCNANWCIECGLSLLGRHESTTMAVERLQSTNVGEFAQSKGSDDCTCKDPISHLETADIMILPSSIASHSEASATKIAFVDPIVMSQERHWETSKTFGRKKPIPIRSKILQGFERSMYKSEVCYDESSLPALRQKTQYKVCYNNSMLLLFTVLNIAERMSRELYAEMSN